MSDTLQHAKKMILLINEQLEKKLSQPLDMELFEAMTACLEDRATDEQAALISRHRLSVDSVSVEDLLRMRKKYESIVNA